MNRNVIIGFFVFALIIGGLLWWMEDGTPAPREKELYSNWDSKYDVRSKDPNDLYFLLDLVHAHTNDTVMVINSWNQFKTVPKEDSVTFLFIGEEMGLTNAVYDTLMHRVDSGSVAYFSFDYVSSNVYRKHFKQDAYYWDFDENIWLWVGDTALSYYSVFQNDTVADNWYFFDPESIVDSNYRAYQFVMDYPTAFYSKKGRGQVHFHSIPQLFSNVQVLTPHGLAHLKQILSYIPKNKPVVFLQFAMQSREAQAFSNDNSKEKGKGGNKQDESLIQFIMKSPSLRLAFLLTIVLLLLYVLFRSKRREAILPTTEEHRNMSVAFVETLSSIYSSKNTPIGVLQVMRKNFFARVNRHFYIDLTRTDDREVQLKRLIEKTNYPAHVLEEIVNGLDPRKVAATNAHLSDMYKKIQAFYIQTGVIKEKSSFTTASRTIEMGKSLTVGGLALLFGMMILLRGLYVLTMGGSLGIVFALAGALVIFLAVRTINIPLLKVDRNTITRFGLVSGKKSYDLNQGIIVTVQANTTKLDFENGEVLTVSHNLLSKRGKLAFAQFIEFIKHKNT